MTFCEHGMTKELVKKYLSNFTKEECKTLLDPFVGSGTVLVEGSKVAKLSMGVDSNPWALIVAKSKLSRPKFNFEELTSYLLDFTNFEPYIPSAKLEKYYDDETLNLLGKIRAVIEMFQDPLIYVVFAKIAERYSRLRRSPAPKFRKSKKKVGKEDIVSDFIKELKIAIDDIRTYDSAGDFNLFLADSSSWLPKRFDGILTSPPFANNIDYIRHTQLHLLWMGFAKNSEELGRLRSLQIPACEAAARKWKDGIDDEEIVRTISKINSKRKYSTFLSQYFYAMKKHFELVSDGLKWEGWYTIGDSYFAGTYVPTHKFLKRLAENSGLEAEIEFIGYRSGKNRRLYLLKVKGQ